MTVRNLYAPAALGIEGYMNARERTKMQVNNIDSFKAKMEEFVSGKDTQNLIFTEDLKNMVHISEAQDINLLRQMIEKFSTQKKELRFGTFVFGPPVMRLLYHLKDCDNALAMFKDESLNGFFDQLISYQILLDMLFVHERYQDVLDTYDVIKSRQVQGGRFPKHVLVLTLAACYKLNTPASFEYATTLYKEAIDSGHLPMRRGVCFFAMLAFNQNQPQIALEVVGTVRQQNYLTIRAIKAMGNSQLKRFDSVLPLLKSVLEVDNPMATKQTFPQSVIDHLKVELDSLTNNELKADFEKVLGFLERHGHITPNSLDDILLTEIQQTVQFPGNDGRDGFQRDGYRRDNREGGYNNREGGYNRDGGYNNRNNDRRDRDDRRGGFQKREFDYPSGRTRPGLHELN